MSYKKIVCLSDQHIPYLDKKAHKVTLKLMNDIKPDEIILLGDLIDLWQISKFIKDPAREMTLKDDCSQAKEYLTELRDTFPNAGFVYLFGNHEDRLRKYIWTYSPALSNFIYLEDELNLDNLKIQYYKSDTDIHREGILLFTHGTMVSQESAMTARRMLQKYGMSIIHGHSHRLGSHYKTRIEGTLGAWENGCQCDRALAKEWRMGFPDWQTGFSMVSMKDKRFYVDNIYIHEGTILWGGKEYKAK